MIGQVVGKYKITAKLGRGGMADVYRGLDLMLEREVAIKVLLPELARQSHLVERFRSEAALLAKLNHPHIATLYDFDRQVNDLFYMVMEYVPGHTLDETLRMQGAMQAEEAVPLFAQILDGIGHAHERGIVHRDLKPANIMLTQTGAVKVMDFGIAHALGAQRLTLPGRLIGTFEYMSPEQVLGQATDPRADIYALGILLFEMVTGRVPFSRDSEYELMRAQIEELPPPPREFAPQTPEFLEQAILRALEKRREDRFPNVVAFRSALAPPIVPQRPKPTRILSEAEYAAARRAEEERRAETERLTAELRRQAAEEARQQAATEAARLLEEARRHAEAEAARITAEQRSRAAHEAEQLAAEKLREAEAAAAQLLAESQRQAAAAARLFQQQEEAERLRHEQAEAERLRRQQEEEAQRQHERAEIARLHQEAEARRRGAEEEAAQLKAAALQQAEEERRRRAAEEAARQQREAAAARQQAEQEAARRVQEIQHQAEQEAAQLLAAAHQHLATLTETGRNETGRAEAAEIVPNPVRRSLSRAGKWGAGSAALLTLGLALTWLNPQRETPPVSPTPPPSATATPRAQPETIRLPGGTFWLGRKDPTPQAGEDANWALSQWPAHPVTVGAFAIDKTEVTNEEYADFVRATKYAPPAEGDWHNGELLSGRERWPVRFVTYAEAEAFARWRSARDQRRYRLPTEAEWEFAAKGTRDQRYPWGNAWENDRANLQTRAPKPVGSYPDGKSPQGVLDLLGNVAEWTSSEAALYPGNPAQSATANKTMKIVRGGAYSDPPFDSKPLSVTARVPWPPAEPNLGIGFRLVCEVP